MNTRGEQVRVFVALDLPQHAKETLEAAASDLRNTLPAGIRWVQPAGIHLTLKFLGDVDSNMVGPLLEAMTGATAPATQRPFDLKLSGLGMFPSEREPRVLWAGINGDLAALNDLQQSVDRAISALGFAPERRPFRPHLTLGRVRDQVWPADRRRIGSLISQARLPDSPPWQVSEVHLIKSNLTPQGAIYSSLGTSSLAN